MDQTYKPQAGKICVTQVAPEDKEEEDEKDREDDEDDDFPMEV